MLRSSTLLAVALAVLSACSRDAKMSAADSAELARDLALATQPAAQPQLQDIPLQTPPVTQQSRPAPRATAPRRTSPGTAQAPLDTSVLRVERSAPAPQPEPAPASRFRGFEAGTSFALSTKTQVCTTNLPGDKIVAVTTEPVTGTNGAYLPAGTTVVLEVASVTQGDSPESAQISLRVRSIDINEQATSVDGSVAIASGLERREVARNKNADRNKVVGGAVAGAVIGQIMGRNTKSTVIGAAVGGAAGAAAAAASRKYDACLPAGGNVRVTTTSQIAVSA